MSKRLTETEKNTILKLLAEGATYSSIAKQTKLSRHTIARQISLIQQSDSIKKASFEAIKKEVIDNNISEVQKMDRIIRDSLDQMTPAELSKQNSYAKAIIIGTIIDKRQLLTGGVTDIVELRDSQALSDKLKLKLSKSKSAKIPEKPDNKSIGFGAKIKID